jgi:hypothetical protein
VKGQFRAKDTNKKDSGKAFYGHCDWQDCEAQDRQRTSDDEEVAIPKAAAGH